MNVKIKKLHEKAIIPEYQTKGSAGFDLHALVDPSHPGSFELANSDDTILLKAGQTVVLKTGLAMAIPEGYEMQIRPRSGLAAKYGATVVNSPGTVDSDYRGEIMVILKNGRSKRLYVKNGDRIAQAVVKRVEQATFEVVDDLDDTERGSGGFGSTGK